MLKVFKEIKEKNLEAKRIIENARAKAEEIKKKAEQEAPRIYEKTYNLILNEAEKKAAELRTVAIRDTQAELENIKASFEKNAGEIEERAKRKSEEAVDYVLRTVLGGD